LGKLSTIILLALSSTSSAVSLLLYPWSICLSFDNVPNILHAMFAFS
jgi:hypothetical protein